MACKHSIDRDMMLLQIAASNRCETKKSPQVDQKLRGLGILPELLTQHASK